MVASKSSGAKVNTAKSWQAGCSLLLHVKWNCSVILRLEDVNGPEDSAACTEGFRVRKWITSGSGLTPNFSVYGKQIPVQSI
jgi:hypothetical protein